MLALEGAVLARGHRVLARGIGLELDTPGLTVLGGANGCGKSSLLRALKGLLPLAGGRRVLSGGLVESRIGLLLPDPQNQLLSDSVLGELSLPLRFARLPRETILERCEALGRELDLLDLFRRDPRTLSGGLQQLVCLGAILIQQPRVLLLDEVCTFLDRPHRERLADLVARRAETASVLQVSHRQEVAERARHCLELGPEGIHPVDPGITGRARRVGSWIARDQALPGGPATGPRLVARGLHFRWPGQAEPVYQGLEAELCLGGGCLLTGLQAQGKSSLVLLAAGLLDPESGSIGLEPAGVALPLFQYAEKQFTGECLRQELLEGMPDKAGQLADLWQQAGLSPDLLDQPSRTLSSGEGRLAALVSLLLLEPAALLLDEPFTGLDASGVIHLRSLLARWRDQGGGLLLATHDPELARDLCASRWEVCRGRLLPRE